MASFALGYCKFFARQILSCKMKLELFDEVLNLETDLDSNFGL